MLNHLKANEDVAGQRTIATALRLSAMAAMLASTGLAGQAYAQTADAATSAEATVEQDEMAYPAIVVTAQRRAEGIEDVPISIQAFDQQQLADLRIESTSDLQFATPGLTNTSTAGDGIAAVFIRGVGTGYSGPGLEGSVAFYLDDIYLQTQTSSAQETVDIAQVQVLKGPQGTLYGRNATGGAVVVTTVDPKYGVTEGYVKGGYGNLDWARGEFVLNIPEGDNLAMRAAGYFERRDGYVENLSFPGEKDSGVGAGKTYGARLKIGWQPTDAFEAIATFSYDRRNGNGAIHSLRYDPTGARTGTDWYDTRQSRFREGGGGDDTDGLLAALRTTYETGAITFSNTLSYRRTRAFGCTDNDGIAAEVLYFCSVSDRSPNPGTADGKRDDTIVNEFRAVTDFDGPLNVTAGLFYENNDARFVGRVGGSAFGGATPTFDNRDKLDAYSAYLELYYDLTDRLKLTAGARYTKEDKYHSVRLDADAGGPLFVEGKTSFDNVSPRLVLAYDADEWNFYASVGRGFKSGGFNSPSFGIEPPLDPETITAGEVGAKYVSPDGSLRFSTAGYYYDWKDVQVAFITGGGAGIQQQNAAGAEIYGLEANLDYAPLENLRLSLGAGYTHGRFSKFPNAAVYDLVAPAGGGTPVLTATAENLKGERIPHAPDFTANGSITYDFPVGNWQGSATAAARYTTKYDFTAGAGGQLRAARQDAHALVNLTADFISPDEGVEIGLFVENLFDVKRISLISTGDTGVYQTPDEPRTFGGTVQFNF